MERVFVLAKAGEASDSLDISRPLALWEQAPGWPLAAKGLGSAETPPRLQPSGRRPITYWRMGISRSL